MGKIKYLVGLNSSRQVISQTKYKAWGEVRQATGTSPTNYTYTGQYSYTADFGLMFYNARWYDPALGRFAQADTIIPDGVQGLDRYAYVNNSPMNFIDPTGHETCDADGWCGNQNNEYNSDDANVEEDDTSLEDLLEHEGSYCQEYGVEQICTWSITWIPSKFPGGTLMLKDMLRSLDDSNFYGIEDYIGFIPIADELTAFLVNLLSFADGTSKSQVDDFEENVNTYLDHNPNNEVTFSLTYSEQIEGNGANVVLAQTGVMEFTVTNDSSTSYLVITRGHIAAQASSWFATKLGE